MIEDIEKIIKIFEGAKISKLDLELDNMKIKLEKSDNKEIIYTNIDSNNTLDSNVSDNKVQEEGVFIEAPVVGTFYGQRSEKSEPFVTVGSKVKKGDVLCIIEAMKVMNEVTSDKSGVIKEILVNNEDMVMYGQKLFRIGEAND